MVTERSICLDGTIITAVISDEPEALLAAKAAGRAVVGVESEGTDIWDLRGIPYVIPAIEDATDELLELVIRRHLGLPWNICRTARLLIRELTAEDACRIPEEEYGPQEAIFRSRDTLELYCRNQYPFYEYGTWALVRRKDQVLVGLAGVSNPRLAGELEACLDSMGRSVPWLELGYHIFLPYRRRGYCGEAVSAIAAYSRQVLGVRLCALIHRENQASRKVAEGLGMTCLMETDTQSSGGQLLYGESPV